MWRLSPLLGVVAALVLSLIAVIPAAAGGHYPTTTLLTITQSTSITNGSVTTTYTGTANVTVDGEGTTPPVGTLSIQECQSKTGIPAPYTSCDSGGGGQWVTIKEATPPTSLSASTTAFGAGFRAVYKGKQGYGSSESTAENAQ